MGRPAAKTGKWLAAGLGCAGLFLLCGTLVFLLGRGSVPAGPAAPPFVAIEPGSGGDGSVHSRHHSILRGGVLSVRTTLR